MATSSTTMSFSSLCILFAVLAVSEAADFLVGGSANAWEIPTASAPDTLSQWAEASRFQVGDSLLWKYDKEKDSVLQVTREGYLSCNTTDPIAAHKDGATVVKLPRSGAYYFVSGAEGACEKGEKVVVVVMAERSALRGLGHAPARAPTASEGPAAAPTSGGAAAAGMKGGALSAMLVLGVVGMVM